jgi:peptide/nickel transport system ATP-binding protein
MTLLFITHDLTMAAHLSDEIAVMSRGRIVEHGPTAKILRNPGHDATRQLLAAVPQLPSAPWPTAQQ